jgi:hypothetical protein
MRRAIDRRLRHGIRATAALAVGGYAMHALGRDHVPPIDASLVGFLGFWLFVHAALTCAVLCLVAVVEVLVNSDEPIPDSDGPPPAPAAFGGGRRL